MPPRQPPRKAKGVVGETSTIKTTASKVSSASKVESKTRVAKRKVIETSSEPEITSEGEEVEPKPVKKRKAIVKAKLEEEDSAAEEPKAAAPKKRRATKAKAKPEDAMPLVERTAISSLKKAMYIGAHVSGAGGVHNSITNTVHIGANAFALFLKSQRKWANPPITPEARDGFKNLSKKHKFEVHKHCLPHGSYLVNLAQAEKEKADQAYGAFLDDLQRCNVIGSTFEDLRDIIALIDDKTRVGVCIDTCHAFAAGYDLRSPEAFAATMLKFNEVVGTSYLRALHINDSKAPFASHRDLHANIGTGFLGLRAFHNVMNYDSLTGLPMVLETPTDRPGPNGKTIEDKQVWADEIKLLESLIDMDATSPEFTALEEKLQAQGASERTKIQDQVDRKGAKDAKKTSAKPRGKKKKKAEEDSDDGSE
ncbi:hypothetical protein E0Z10_g763 [Xylaria hypoxylon]|uniref:Xylose isomerase-like TIM barrel domain-containing protein n=1 Tax=Xylaria hypoxylon TaxID=37992 RepID=A0A4Z0Z8U8_9PEZI|nr:hypothetical protein E0Z10_g763 [Xylaria hypoxylon]